MPSFSATAPAISEEDERRELANLSEDERRELEHDLRPGRRSVGGEGGGRDGDSGGGLNRSASDTIEEADVDAERKVLERARETLIEALDGILDHEKEAYNEALRVAPHLVESESPLDAFLRCERYDAWAAANLLAMYWKTRRKIFGPTKAFLPLDIDGAILQEESSGDCNEEQIAERIRLWEQTSAFTADDVQWLRKDYFRVLPQPDQFGRKVLFLDRSKISPQTAQERESVARYYFYVKQNAFMNSIDGQRLGSVLIEDVRQFDMYRQFDRKLLKLFVAIDSSLPMKLRTLHVCANASATSVFSLLLPTVKAIATRFIRQRIVFHAGNDEVLSRELVELYGIDPESIGPIFGAHIFGALASGRKVHRKS